MNFYDCSNFDVGRPVTLPIRVFNKYIRRDGKVVEAFPPHPECPNEFICVGETRTDGQVVHRKTGLHNSFRGITNIDIIADFEDKTK